ncbi:hypothetical protein [Solidesulfovibrio sp.]|uniref:hypothetical protein n=1 Tax=Solidesulfovibrio sp. TaxID=2910990 RepID=UPI002B203763|nr:hypothetical protein [Solidesulfovibrio sp.]MEA4856262.1 hypothetical protein [Solidesulfovibrio sp.]
MTMKLYRPTARVQGCGGWCVNKYLADFYFEMEWFAAKYDLPPIPNIFVEIQAFAGGTYQIRIEHRRVVCEYSILRPGRANIDRLLLLGWLVNLAGASLCSKETNQFVPVSDFCLTKSAFQEQSFSIMIRLLARRGARRYRRARCPGATGW